MGASIRWRVLALLMSLVLCSRSAVLGQSLSYTDCSPPKAFGGNGYCGPSQCANIPTNNQPGCDFQAACTGNQRNGCTSSINYQIQARRCMTGWGGTKCVATGVSVCVTDDRMCDDMAGRYLGRQSPLRCACTRGQRKLQLLHDPSPAKSPLAFI